MCEIVAFEIANSMVADADVAMSDAASREQLGRASKRRRRAQPNAPQQNDQLEAAPQTPPSVESQPSPSAVPPPPDLHLMTAEEKDAVAVKWKAYLESAEAKTGRGETDARKAKLLEIITAETPGAKCPAASSMTALVGLGPKNISWLGKAIHALGWSPAAGSGTSSEQPFERQTPAILSPTKVNRVGRPVGWRKRAEQGYANLSDQKKAMLQLDKLQKAAELVAESNHIGELIQDPDRYRSDAVIVTAQPVTVQKKGGKQKLSTRAAHSTNFRSGGDPGHLESRPTQPPAPAKHITMVAPSRPAVRNATMLRSLNAASKKLAGVSADSPFTSDSFFLADSMQTVAESPIVLANTSDEKRRVSVARPDPTVVANHMAALGLGEPDSQD